LITGFGNINLCFIIPLLVFFSCAQKETNDAIPATPLAVTLVRDSVEILFHQAEELLNFRDKDSALSTFKKLAGIYVNRPLAFVGLGKAYLLFYFSDTLYADSTIDAYNKALQIDPQNCRALSGMIDAAIYTRKYQLALSKLRKFNKCDDTFHYSLFTHALTYEGLNNRDSATWYARKYLMLDSTSKDYAESMKLLLSRDSLKNANKR
jgi:tetratricopeptide (TPR) repeat protein